jgi:polygalacturonase
LRNPFECLRIAGIFIVCALAGANTHAAVCDVQAYGAKPDGAAINTAAIQKAIDACAAKGGGAVRLAGGVFLSGPIVLKSNIRLEIAKGATLLGSSNHADYPKITEFRDPALQPLVSATNADNISITGGGVIDGAGQSWWKEAHAQGDHGVMGKGMLRPRLIVFNHCRHILIQGVTVQNSPFWQIVPYYSSDVRIRNIRVLADPHSPNTDAIDPFSSSDVVIDHVYADVGDDNVAIKSGQANSPGPDAPSRNITIRDCTFLHGHGISIGSEIAGGAQNITVSNIHFRGTDNGIRIKANRDRGNDVSHLVFRNIQMKNVRTALSVSEYYPRTLPPDNDAPHPVTRLTPHFHDIVIENLQATGANVAGIIIGLPESPVRDVVLKNVSIRARKGLIISNAYLTGHNVVIQPQEGPPMTIASSAKVEIK